MWVRIPPPRPFDPFVAKAPQARTPTLGPPDRQADRQPKAPANTISCAVRTGPQTPSSRFESMTTVRSREG